jgi:hypothetical protein
MNIFTNFFDFMTKTTMAGVASFFCGKYAVVEQLYHLYQGVGL